MNKTILVIILVMSAFNLGCESVFAELKKTPPDNYVEVIPAGPNTDVKAALEAAGVDHVCKELYFGKGSSKNRKACFVKAPPAGLYEKLEVKMSDLPSAILQDTGRNAILVGEVAMILITSRIYIPK